jgi:hypothetical protein
MVLVCTCIIMLVVGVDGAGWSQPYCRDTVNTDGHASLFADYAWWNLSFPWLHAYLLSCLTLVANSRGSLNHRLPEAHTGNRTMPNLLTEAGTLTTVLILKVYCHESTRQYLIDRERRQR